MLKTPGIKLILASGLLTLTACSAPRTQVQETKEEVSALAQKMNGETHSAKYVKCTIETGRLFTSRRQSTGAIREPNWRFNAQAG